MRRRSVLVWTGAAIVVVLLLGSGLAAEALKPRDPSPSRAAADRACERQYVATPVEPGASDERAREDVVASLEQPTVIAFDPEDPTSGVIGERPGKVLEFVDDDFVNATEVIDLAGDTADEGDGGLLGLAYTPAGTTGGRWLYVYRTRHDNKHDVVTAYPLRDGSPDQSGERVILDIPHPPIDQHHGGGLMFGPDGHLYISTGDGGGLGDPRGNGQKLSVLLGKVLRIDPTPAAKRPYAVPADNPFLRRSGARPEIYAYGVRNPYRLSFDADTGDLWLADVGHSCWEEVDHEPEGGPAGWNFGWALREGNHKFLGDGPESLVPPVFEYPHRNGWCVIIGGFVYRGAAMPALDGAYLFTDYCRGQLVALRLPAGQPPTLTDTGVQINNPIALMPDPQGEPILLSLDGDVARVVPRK